MILFFLFYNNLTLRNVAQCAYIKDIFICKARLLQCRKKVQVKNGKVHWNAKSNGKNEQNKLTETINGRKDVWL